MATAAPALNKSQKGAADAVELFTKLGFEHRYNLPTGEPVLIQSVENGDRPETVSIGSYGRITVLTAAAA